MSTLISEVGMSPKKVTAPPFHRRDDGQTNERKHRGIGVGAHHSTRAVAIAAAPTAAFCTAPLVESSPPPAPLVVSSPPPAPLVVSSPPPPPSTLKDGSNTMYLPPPFRLPPPAVFIKSLLLKIKSTSNLVSVARLTLTCNLPT